jgi:tRNA A-37 threonylcarbamoyl transferase component Bud32/tetratricopeptide (TPR) repeat protein
MAVTELLRDRYEPLEVAGSGGEGTVFRALDHFHGRAVALKLRPVGPERDREALLDEARALLAARPHAGIAVARDDFFADDRYVLVMDWIEGTSLQHELAARGDPGFPAATVLAWLEQAADALDHLHRHDPPIVHGDVKPANLILAADGRVVLVDFGLAGSGERGLGIGTRGFVAPEVAARLERGPAADVYGLAATAVALLTGAAPSSSSSDWEGVPAGVAASAEAALRGALASDPARRPRSAREVVERLRSHLQAAPANGVGTPGAVTEAIATGEVAPGPRDGLDALARKDWPAAYAQLTAADARRALDADELEALGEAALWAGHPAESALARQRAHAAHLRAGNRRRAAVVALGLVINHVARLDGAVATGWFSKAKRLLEGEPEGPEHAYVELTTTLFRQVAGDLDGALESARAAYELASRYGDPDAEALALVFQGFVLARQGSVAEGMALMDEAMASALTGELGPLASGLVYCRTICACLDLLDYRRAAEWTQAIERCRRANGEGGFPGDCRTHHAAILFLRGDWTASEQEALLACDESATFDLVHAGLASYELGELRLRQGDLARAGAAFRRAHELGTTPQPGFSLLRLAEGNCAAAGASIRSALAAVPADPLARERLLPAAVEIALAEGELERAHESATELATIAERFQGPAPRAAAACAQGAVLLADEQAEQAAKVLREGCQLWLESEAPYEAARARMLLADALGALGDQEASLLELSAARETFERMGALPDSERAARRSA